MNFLRFSFVCSQLIGCLDGFLGPFHTGGDGPRVDPAAARPAKNRLDLFMR